MNAQLVFDGRSVILPPEMGTPSDNQFQGTELEKLGESASRICYDSYGTYDDGKPRGRSSEKLHAHILDVQNLSVYEHCTFTVRFKYCPSVNFDRLARACLNRKGVRVEQPSSYVMDVTINFRAVLEWERHTDTGNWTDDTVWIGTTLAHYANQLAPMIAPWSPTPGALGASTLKIEDLSDDQANITLYMAGSRGMSHEQVRHRFAVSQRSTRYVDEDGSPYVTHPLVAKYMDDVSVVDADRMGLLYCISDSIYADRKTYKSCVAALEAYLLGQGVDKASARKQARGASRGYLGNALFTELLFTAPISGWKWMLRQRKNKLADAEIREVYSHVLSSLKASQYGDRFSEFETVPTPDGLGTVLT